MRGMSRTELAVLEPPPLPSCRGIDPERVATDLEDASAEEALRWAIETFHPSLYVASSFQKTSSVIVDMATKIEPEMRFFYLDTDVLFDETYAVRDELAERYNVTFDRFHNISLDEQARLHGDELWKTNPDACCGIRKVDPMGEALSSVDCWISGIRRSESQGRAQRAEVPLGQALRTLEAEPARRLVRAGRLELPRQTPGPLQRAPRQGLPVDRLHPLHEAGRRGRGRARRPLGRQRPRTSAAFTTRPATDRTARTAPRASS